MMESLESRIAPATIVITNLNDAGAGSLRDAIAAANDDAGPDLIVFKRGLIGEIELTSGPLIVSDNLTIKGPGATKLALVGDLTNGIMFVFDNNTDADSPVSISGLEF